MNNKEISWIFLEIADLLEMKGDNPFKIRSYRNAARLLSELDVDVAIYSAENRLTELPGIGEALADKINELISTGSLSYLVRLRQDVPIEFRQLLTVPGIGPRTLNTIFNHLGINTISELKTAALKGELRDLPGIGKKSETSLKRALAKLPPESFGLHLSDTIAILSELTHIINQLPFVEKISIAGQARRKEEFITKALLLVSANRNNFPLIMQRFSTAPYVRRVINTSVASLTALLGVGLEIDLVAVTPDTFATSLCYYTGPKDHWKGLCDRAIDKGFHLTPDRLSMKGQSVDLFSEEDLYSKLGLEFIIPELRWDRCSIQNAATGTLPTVIQTKDILGDLHIHSNYSDGRESISSLAKAALKRGYQYIAITDHSQSLKIAKGLNLARLGQQRLDIAAVSNKYPGIVILSGTEVDILTDGSLDYEDSILSGLDIVIASIHSGFNQNKETMTKRIISAIQNPYVDILGHPTGRKLGKRPGYEVDLDAVLQEARTYGIVLEINSSPERLDLDAQWAMKAKKLGIKMAINTDAHDKHRLADVEYGINVAQRAGLEISDVINAWPLEKLQDFLKNKARYTRG